MELGLVLVLRTTLVETASANGIIWKTVQLALDTKNLHKSQWEVVLPVALHSMRSLLCTATNMTPHERFFCFARRTTAGHVCQQGTVLLRRHVRVSKYDPCVMKLT